VIDRGHITRIAVVLILLQSVVLFQEVLVVCSIVILRYCNQFSIPGVNSLL